MAKDEYVPFTGKLDAAPQFEPFDGTLDGEKPKEPGLLRKAGDLGLSVAKGIVAVPEAAVGLADIPTGGRIGKFLENEGGAFGFRPKQAKEYLSSLQSDDLQSKQKQFQQADGVLDKAGVALSNPSLVANAVAESVPLMGAGAVPARALLAAAPRVGAAAAGAIGEGVVGAGSAAEQIRQETPDALLTPTQSGLAAATGAATSAFGFAGGKVAQRLGIGDVDTMFAQGAARAAGAPSAKSIPRQVVEGAIAEGWLEELPQSVSEQVLQNLALNKPWHEGVSDAAVMGTLAGMAMGGGAAGVAGFSQPTPEQTPPPNQPAPVPPPVTGPTLALPAPDRGVIEVAGDGTARTPAYQAPGYVGDVTDVEPRAVNPVREQVAAAAEQGGALSSAALTAIDTGLSDAMQPAPEQAPPEISLEEADARDRAAYEQFFAGFDADPVVSRYFENDDDIPDFDAASNASEEDFLRALGATDEDIQDAIATTSQSAIPQSSAASNAGPQAYEPAGPREGAGEGAASQTGQVNAGAIQQAAPDAPVPGVGGQVGADGAGSAATAVSGASGAGGAGTGAATGSGAGATEAGIARAGGRGDSNQAQSAPANLRDALVRVRQQKQEAANAKAATPEAAPATTAPAAGTGAVEAAGVEAGGFDSAAWDKARADTIKASKNAGNKHLDEVPAYVESMRGKQVYYAHDNKVRGVIRTVDNRGNVYIDWADNYSAEKEMASPVKEGKKTVMRSSIGPTDLKDYVVGAPKAPTGNAQPATTEGANLVPQAAQAQQDRAQPPQAGGPQAGAATATASTSPAGGNRVQAAGVSNAPTPQNTGAQAAPAAGAQGEAQGGAVEALRQQLRDVEDKILAAAPGAMGQGGGDIEAAMKSRKVPVTLKAQRTKLKEQLQQSKDSQQNQPPAQVQEAQSSTENVASNSNGQDEKAIRYELPPEKYAQQQGDESWMAAQSPSFKPTARQQLVMDAVAKALDDGAFYNRDVDEHVAQALGVTREQRARNSRGVEGGDFGYDVYNARKAVEAQRGNAKSREFAKALNLKPGDLLGTLVFNDGKVTTGVKVIGLSENGLIATINGKRGAAALNGEAGVDSLAAAMDRAKERGKRKDGYAEYVAGRGAERPSDAMAGRAETGGQQPTAPDTKAQAATETVANDEKDGRAQQPMPAFDAYNDAMDWAKARAKSMGMSFIAYRSTDEFKNGVSQQLESLYKTHKAKWDADTAEAGKAMQAAMAQAGIRPGDTVEWVQSGAFLSQDRMSGVVRLDSNGVPQVHMGSEIAVAKPGGKIGYTKKLRWQDYMKKSGEAGKREQNQPEAPAKQAPAATEPVAQTITRADVEDAQQQAATLIGERIDAMTAGEVNTIARRFLPTMGVKPTVSKERNKAAITDFTKVNPMAAADEFGVTLPADVRRALDAEMQGKVADAGRDDGVNPRVTRENTAQSQQAEPSPLDYTPKQYADAWLRWVAESNGLPLAEVREMQGDEAGLKAIEQRWVDAVVQEAKNGQSLPAKTLDKLLEVRPNAQLPESAIPDGYQRSQARKQEADEQQARADNRKKARQGAADASPIEDFGQKLEGARKDMPPSLKEEVSDEKIASLPLSKIWPSDAHESIEDDAAAALVFAARQEIPAKPRVPGRVRAWVEKVKTYRTLVKDLGKNSLERIEQLSKEKGFHSLDPFFAKVRLLSQLPRDTWSRVERVEEYPNAIRYEKDGSKTAVAFSSVTIDGKSRRFEGVGKIGPDEVQAVKEMLGTTAPKKGGLTAQDFEVRGTAKTGYKINRKGDSEYRSLKIFTGEDAAKKALAWRDEHTAELEAAWEAVKARDNVSKAEVRRDENRERAGENRRNGKDVTEEMFDRAFGFRGVQFGNWVGQGAEAKGRQGMLNDAYDALLDLADILGIPSKAISLNGTLGLSFGARGSGKASAHFEPSNLVINLTKTRGAGSLAHEWFHALDNYFSRMRGGEVAFTGDNNAYRQNNFVTYKPEAAWGKAPITPYTNFMRGGQLRERLQRLPGFTYDANKTLAENAKAAGFERDPGHKDGVRPQVEKAFADLVQALNDSPMAKRASSLDKAADGYWGRIIERGARSFENYVISKMAQRGWSNDFLANIRSFDEWMAMGKNAERYPYLKPEEDAPVVAAFDKLFETVEAKEDDTGNVVLFSRSGAQSANAQQPTTRAWYDRFVSLLPESYRNDPHRREPLPAEDWNVQRASEVRSKVEALNKQLRGENDRRGYGPISIDGLGNLQVSALQVSRDDLNGPIKALAKELGAGIAITNVRTGDIQALQDSGFVPEASLAPVADRIMGRLFDDPANRYAADARAYGTIMTYQPRGFPAVMFARDAAAQSSGQPLRTPAATIRAAIAKAYGKLLGQLESKGLVTLTQTEDEAIEAAAQARAAKTGQSVEQARATLRASVKNSVADQTQTEAFKRWFGDSKVVDSEGNPLRVYHGTSADFSVFDGGKSNSRSMTGVPASSFVFSTSSEAAGTYAGRFDRQGWDTPENQDRWQALWDAGKVREASKFMAAHYGTRESVFDPGARIMPVYLSAKNPLIVDASGATWKEIPWRGEKANINGLADFAKKQGHDGLIVRNVRDQATGTDAATPADTVFVFRPEQVKSAIGNRGTFDPADPDIRRSADGSIQGFFDPQTGQSFLIADNLTAEAAPGVLMHEVGIHMAADGSMKALFNRAAMMLKLQRGNPFMKAVQDRMDAAGETSGEEAAAYIAEAYENDRANAPASVQRWLADLLAAVKAWMFKKGIMGADRLTVADIAAVARANARSMARGDGATGGQGFGTAFSRGPAGDQTQTEAFKRWFKDSKVVDAEGKPLRVYHGTGADIEVFNVSERGEFGGGIYLTPDTKGASDYATYRGQGPANVMPVYVSIKNPASAAEASQVASWKGEENAQAELIRRGYDGVIDMRSGQVVAFRPEQVKSAIGNNGTFDPANPDIRFSRADLSSRATEAAKAVGDTLKSITVSNVKQRAGFKLTDYLGIGLQALGRRQIVDIYGDMLPLAEYNKLVQQMEADKNEGGAEADKLVTRWADLPDEGKLADLMHDATLAQIDPAKPYVGGDDKAKYAMLAGRFNALSQEAKQVYTDTRDAYQAHHAKVRSAIKERIERSELKGPRKAELLKRMDDEFFAAVKGVYFPLARFGQYAVTVKGPDGKVESVSRAETKAEAEALRNNLLSAFPRDKGFTVGRVMLSKDFIADRDAVGRGFMTELYQVLDKQDMDAAQRAELEDTLGQLYLSSLPDLSWAKHGIHRKGTPGFSQDARRAYAQNMFHGARYLAKLRYSDLMQDELTAMQKHVDDWREVEDFDQNSAQRVVDEMNKRHESLMNPKSNPLSTALTSLGFVFHLGLSPASAMVNLSQTALVAYPIMGAKWGFGKASAALLKASKQAAAGKNDITGSLNADERAAYDEAVRAGTIDVTMAHDLAGIAQGEDAGVMWKLRPVMRWASFLFHHAERFNRQVTFVAAYRLAREAGADHKSAFEQATKATYDGHFDYGAANRPRIMQGNVAKVLLLFKQYGQNMVYTLSRNAYQSIKGTDAEKAEARKALAGLLTSHAMAAGVLGLPMVTTLLAAASMIGGDDDEPWDAKVALQNMLADAFGQKPAEVLAHGLSRLTPWDISGRVGLDRLIFPDVQEGLEGQRLAESAMAAALGPVAGIGVNMLKGAQHMSEGRYALGLEAMLPSALRGPVKAIRYANEGVQDKSGISILDEVSPAAVAGQALGFSPSQARNAQEGKSAVMAHDRALGERRQELLTKAARATMAKDAEARAEAMKEIERFNQKNPTRRITPLNVLQSVRNRNKRIDQAQDGVYLPRNRRDAMDAGRFAFAGTD